MLASNEIRFPRWGFNNKQSININHYRLFLRWSLFEVIHLTPPDIMYYIIPWWLCQPFFLTIVARKIKDDGLAVLVTNVAVMQIIDFMGDNKITESLAGFLSIEDDCHFCPLLVKVAVIVGRSLAELLFHLHGNLIQRSPRDTCKLAGLFETAVTHGKINSFLCNKVDTIDRHEERSLGKELFQICRNSVLIDLHLPHGFLIMVSRPLDHIRSIGENQTNLACAIGYLNISVAVGAESLMHFPTVRPKGNVQFLQQLDYLFAFHHVHHFPFHGLIIPDQMEIVKRFLWFSRYFLFTLILSTARAFSLFT